MLAAAAAAGANLGDHYDDLIRLALAAPLQTDVRQAKY